MTVIPAADERKNQTVRFGPFKVDLDAGRLVKHGIRIGLREQSFQVLALLLKRPGQIVTRDELRQKLWHDEVFVDFDKSLNTAVARLRQALGDSADHPRFIETLPKRGYRFVAAVSTTVEATPASMPHRARLLVLPFINLSGDPAKDYFCDAITTRSLPNSPPSHPKLSQSLPALPPCITRAATRMWAASGMN